MNRLKDFVGFIDGLSAANKLDSSLSNEKFEFSYQISGPHYGIAITYRKRKEVDNFHINSYALNTSKHNGPREKLFKTIKGRIGGLTHASYGAQRDSMTFVAEDKQKLLAILKLLEVI